MFSLICSQLLLIAILHLWPAIDEQPRENIYETQSEEIFVEDVIVTRQSSAPASPPKPQTPVPVPDDEIIEEEIDFPDIDDIFTNNPVQIENDIGRVGNNEGIVGSPDQRVGILRIVEPTTPEAVKRQNIKAELIVSFLVGKAGEVEEVFISEMRLYNGDSYEVVNEIGYGLMEAVLEAAGKWRFRAAKDDGSPVRTYVKNSFRIGF
ncbi:MAG: hypothetical protein WD597_11520 [Balneolaceae bacterium]